MDTRLDLHAQARRSRSTGDRGRAGAALAIGLAVLAAIVAGVLVLVVDGHGVSWVAGLIAGAAAAVSVAVARSRTGAGASSADAGAQRRTESELARLEQAGWRFLHGVVGADGTYDHVAVGPGGLILLESMSPAGVVRMNAGEPVVERPGEPQAPHAPQRRLRPRALADATTVREAVERIAGRRMWVQAVVVFWSDFPAGCIADGRCVYIHGSRLAAWLARRPHQLDEAQVDAVYAALREVAEDGAGLGLRVAV